MKRLASGRVKQWLVRIHDIAKAYGQRPSEILFPRIPNPNLQLFIDNLVYEIGRSAEIEAETEWEKAKIEHQHRMLETLIKVLGKLG